MSVVQPEQGRGVTVSHRPWTSSFSVRSLLARPSPVRPRPVPACRPRGPGAPALAGEFYRPLHGAASSIGTTLIEKYIYSLPDYRLHERQRRNFIEIHSFNGLLATRKVIGISILLLIPQGCCCHKQCR